MKVEKMKVDCLIGFSFGLRGNMGGPVNEKLAKYIMSMMRGRPLILQWEIAEYIDPQKAVIAKVIKNHRVEGKYLDTYEVAVQAYEVMKQNGWKEYELAAHSAHAFRCAKVMEKLGAHLSCAITIDDYDILSSQIWTKHPLLFHPYNRLALFIYERRGWIDGSPLFIPGVS